MSKGCGAGCESLKADSGRGLTALQNLAEDSAGADGPAGFGVRSVLCRFAAFQRFCSNRSRWLTVVIYAIAMAWVESALVFDLRTMVNRIEPYQPDPLPMIGSLGHIELVREAATVAMLLTVGILAGRTWRSRLGYFAMAFGVWDIFYYVFLKVICGWPHSLLDWDILFLLPMPWWGPVLAPMAIAVLLIVWGTLASQFEAMEQFGATHWRIVAMNSAGIALALYVFMADSIRVAQGGTLAMRMMLPTAFNWPLFSIALVLMASPVIQKMLRMSRNQERPDVSVRGEGDAAGDSAFSR